MIKNYNRKINNGEENQLSFVLFKELCQSNEKATKLILDKGLQFVRASKTISN